MPAAKKAAEPVEPDGRPTVDETFESITGFEEIAIEKAFGSDPTQLAQAGKQIRFLRALVFVDKKRSGLNDVLAKQAAMSMPVRELGEYFADDPENAETGDEGDGPGEAPEPSDDD